PIFVPKIRRHKHALFIHETVTKHLKKTAFYILTVLLLIAHNGYSQSDFKKIDEYAKSIDYIENKSLAKELTKNSTTELEKVRAIFIWITDNIEYDFELYKSPELQDEIYTSEANIIEHTLKSKKAICSGYSFLFKSLCDEIGIESVSITGFSK